MSDGIPVLRSDLLGKFAAHGFSTRKGGVSTGRFTSLNVSARVGDDPQSVQENRRRLLAVVGCDLNMGVAVSQVHGNRVVAATRGDGGQGLITAAPEPEEADALITSETDLALMVVAADCVPILFADPQRHAIGAAHAGWRGTVAGVAQQTVLKMAADLGSRPEDVYVCIGPAIGACCYEVDTPVVDAFSRAFPHHAAQVTQPARPGHWMLDLHKANVLQLREIGILPDHIETLDLCTSCRTDMLYSERREGRPSGRFAGVIALRA